MNDSYCFRLEINRATSVQEIAGELWTIAKNLREGTIQQKYGNDKTPLSVEYEVRHVTQEVSSTSSATASIGEDGKPNTTSESSSKTIIKEVIQTSRSGQADKKDIIITEIKNNGESNGHGEQRKRN